MQHDLERFDAFLFDLDGVLTDTASIHAACWKRMFDGYLRERAEASDEPFVPFEIDTDYLLYVDGKPRFDGVRDFLSSRGISLPEGSKTDPPGHDTVCALGNIKNDMVNEVIDTEGVEAYAGSVAFLEALQAAGKKIGLVSSSANAGRVLDVADLTRFIQVRVDGAVAAQRQIKGKPAPDTFLEAARDLGVEASAAVVIEDAISGVQAGRAGSFGCVVGVARKDNEADLQANGADIVVTDLAELL